MKGRKPTPTQVLNARGSWRGKARKDEPKTKPDHPQCPVHLDAAARAEWKRLCGELDFMGILRSADQASLAVLCQAYSRWVRAEKAIAKDGIIIQARTHGTKAHPGIKIANEAIQIIYKLSAAFGLTPSDRARIHAPSKTKPETDLDAFVASKPKPLKIAKGG